MKFSCTQENLLKGLAVVGHVANRNSSLPILSNVLLRVVKGGLELSATNLEVGVITIVRGKGDEEGAITLQAKLATEAVAFLPKDKVEVESSGTDLVLSCGRQKATIRGLSAEDFPVIPQIDGGENITIPVDELKKTLERVLVAINPEEGRPEISGVYFSVSADRVVVVGTDSYRLAEQVINNKSKISKLEFIISFRAAQELSRILSGSEGEVVVTINENQVLWQVGDTKITSRLIVGQYPDYQPIVPKNFNTTVVVNRDNLIQAVKAASLFARVGINDVRLVVDVEKKVIQISSANSQVGEHNAEIELTKIEGDPNEIVFNYRYLLDGLQVVGGKEIILGIVNSRDPGVIKPLEDKDYFYVIMPIRQ